jgi:nucleotide-binding universal stress UspA family protein
LLHVLTHDYDFGMPEFDNMQLTGVLEMRELGTKKRLDAFLKGKLRDLRVKRILAKGDPAQEIVRCARTENINLIIMPTHGYGPFRRMLMGSVTSKVLHDVDIPVWTGVHLEKALTARSVRLRNIACVVDLSTDSEKAIWWASQLASQLKASLTAIHVVNTFDFPGEGYGPRGWNQRAKDHATKVVAKLLRKCAIDARIHLEVGKIPDAVSSAATKLHTNLLVIGRGPVVDDGGRLPTNAYAIIRTAPCPVVSV